MERQKVDFLFVTPSSDLLHLLGYPAHASERLTLLGIPRIEAQRLEHWVDRIDFHVWDETAFPYEFVARLAEGAIGN